VFRVEDEEERLEASKVEASIRIIFSLKYHHSVIV
jgi:hypothetical protein